MASFRATVGTAGGERLVVEEDARSEQAFLDAITRRGLFVINISPAKSIGSSIWSKLFEGFSISDLLDFTNSLRTLIKAGLPVYQALELINEDEDSAYKRKLLCAILRDLSYGLSFSETLDKHPDDFPVFYVKTIEASEATGTLEKTLQDLTVTLKRGQHVRNKLISAAIYPIVLMVLITGLVFLMLGFVLPNMEVFFMGLGIDLPTDTRLLLALSRWFSTHLMQVTVIIIASVYVAWKIYKEPTFRQSFDELQYKLPVFGKMTLYAHLSLMSRTVAALISSGVPANEALRTSEQTVENTVMKGRIAETILRVERGEAISSAANRSCLLNSRACRVLRVGEEAGSLTNSFTQLSEFCEENLETSTERFFALMEPTMVIIIGLLILLVLATFMRPMLESISRM